MTVDKHSKLVDQGIANKSKMMPLAVRDDAGAAEGKVGSAVAQAEDWMAIGSERDTITRLTGD